MTVQCITCQHFSLRDADRMAAHGFGLCAQRQSHEFMSASFQRLCGKHSELDAEVVAKRKSWMESRR